jgi:hypothetical protein
MSFGLAHIKQEGKPAHPEDIYIHCGCRKCDERFKKQARAYYTFIAEFCGFTPEDLQDPWFPEDLR